MNKQSSSTIKSPSLSVISPVFNEEKNLILLIQSLKTELSKMNIAWEVIFVNDGSTDGSSKILETIASQNKHFKTMELSRNFGQTAAIAAGIKLAKGEIIVFIDADLQNDPKDIKKLYEKILDGWDVVSGWRKIRRDPYFTRILPSVIANKLISLITGVKLHDFGCTLKAYRCTVIKSLDLYGEMHRLIPVYAYHNGATITEINVNHFPRKYGKSHYNLWRIIKILFDLSTAKFLSDYSTKPLYLFGSTAIIILLLGLLIFGFVAFRAIFWRGDWISPLIILAGIMVILSVQFLLIGLLAEILVRIYFESRKNPPYVIKNTLNIKK